MILSKSVININSWDRVRSIFNFQRVFSSKLLQFIAICIYGLLTRGNQSDQVFIVMTDRNSKVIPDVLLLTMTAPLVASVILEELKVPYEISDIILFKMDSNTRPSIL